MKNLITHNWHYHIARSGTTWSLHFNERLIAIITKPKGGGWPVQININDAVYTFSKKNILLSSLRITNTLNGEELGEVRAGFLRNIISRTILTLTNGDQYTWYSNHFFSVHWKWKKGDQTIVDALDSTGKKQHMGTINIAEYREGSDVLIVAGFLLSILEQNRFSLFKRQRKR